MSAERSKSVIGSSIFQFLNDRSTLFIFYAAFFLLAAIVAWGFLGYTDLPAIVSIWILILLSAVYLIYAVALTKPIPLVEKLPFVSFALSLWLFILISKMFYPAAIHDEITIDSYAAYLFLHHIDPYVSANMINVFNFFHFPLYYATPLRAGGYVYYLIYPALSVYAFIPSVALGIPDYWIPLLFNVGTFLILVYYYRKRKFTATIPFIAVLVFVEAELVIGAVTGETDVIWVFFLALSYIFRKKPWMAGVFFGLSIAQKQIPVVIAPFLLYMIYIESGRDKRSFVTPVVAAATVFLALNAPFILMNPGAWFSSMLLSVGQPIIGVGFGFGILSFAGYAPVSSVIFSDLLVTSLAFLFVFYIRYYRSVKYAFFAFPIVIFLFNFRSLENYLIYWPLLTMLVLPDFIKDRESGDSENAKPETSKRRRPFLSGTSGLLKKTNFTVFIMLVIILAGGVSTGYVNHENSAYRSQLKINGITQFQDQIMVNSKITAMTVNLTYSPMDNSKSNIPVFFRIMPNGPLNSNINALLWSAKNPYVRQGNNSLTIYPDFYSDMLPANTSFILEAYYGNITAYYKAVSPVSPANPLQDPFLLYPTTDEKAPFPGWNLTKSGNDGNIVYSSSHLSLGLRDSNGTGQGWNSISISTPVNFTYLADNNYTLSYSASGTNGSYIGRTGTILRFSGILLTFNAGQEKFWYGYNASAINKKYSSFNRINASVVTSNTVLNFSTIREYLSTLGWGFSHAVLSYAVVSTTESGLNFSLSNISLSDNGNAIRPFQSEGGFVLQPYTANIYSSSPDLQAVQLVRPQEVVSW